MNKLYRTSLQLLASFFLIFTFFPTNAQISVSLGSGTGTLGTSPSGPSPYNLDEANRVMQFVYTASEIKAAGGIQGQILSMAWKVKDTITTSINDYGIWMKHTTASNAASHDGTNLKQVKNRFNYPHGSPGWQTLTLDTAFQWDGTKNILVHVCFGTLGSTSASGDVYAYNNTSNQRRGETGKGTVCGLTTVSSYNWKPFIQFVIDPDCTPPAGVKVSNVNSSGADVSWNPAPAGAQGYEYVLQSSYGTPSGSGTYTTDTFLNITGLCPSKLNYLYLRSICAKDDTSGWSQAIIFQTTSGGGITNNAPVCVGDTLKMTVENAQDYSWNGPSGFKSTMQSPTFPTALKGNSGTYNVTITDANNCVVTYSSFARVDTLPSTTLNVNSPACENDNVTIIASNGGTYKWTGPNGFTADTSILDFAKVQMADAGQYVVVAENSFGCTKMDSILLEVNELPTITTTGTSPLCAGDTLLLTVTGNYDFSWSGPNSFTSTSASPAIINVTTVHTGVYKIIAKTTKNCSVSESVTIVVNPLPNVVLSGDIDLCEKDALSLSATGAKTYQWYVNGISSDTGSKYTRAQINSEQAGTHRVQGVDQNGCMAWVEKEVIVKEIPTSNIKFSNPYCEGDDVLLTATTNGSQYVWSGPAGFTSTSLIVTISKIQLSQQGTYKFKATAENGCTSENSAIVFVLPKPIISIDRQGNNLLATAGFSTYKWFLNGNEIVGKTNRLLTAESIGTYTVKVEGGNGCSNTSDEIDLTSLGIRDLEQTFTINPNPANKQFTLITTPNYTSVKIYDLRGVVVSHHLMQNGTCVVDVQQLPAGLYVVQIEGEGLQMKRRLIRQ